MAEPARVDPPEDVSADQSDIEKLAELVADQLVEIRKSIPAASEPAQAPVVNVTTPPAQVDVHVPQAAAPIFNVPVPEVNVSVSPPGAAINLNTETITLTADIAPVVEAIQAGFAGAVEAIREGFAAMRADAASGVEGAGQRSAALVDAIKSFGEQISEQQKSLNSMASALTAPRRIETDAAGQPIGIRIDRRSVQ